MLAIMTTSEKPEPNHRHEPDEDYASDQEIGQANIAKTDLIGISAQQFQPAATKKVRERGPIHVGNEEAAGERRRPVMNSANNLVKINYSANGDTAWRHRDQSCPSTAPARCEDPVIDGNP